MLKCFTFTHKTRNVFDATAKFLDAVKFAPISKTTIFNADDPNTAVDVTYATVSC